MIYVTKISLESFFGRLYGLTSLDQLEDNKNKIKDHDFTILNNKLKVTKCLVVDTITAADIYVGMIIILYHHTLVDIEFRYRFPKLSEWLRYLINLP